MATLYYNNDVDSNLNTVGNWWTDESATTPAGRVPTTGDDAIILPSVFAFAGTLTADNVYIRGTFGTSANTQVLNAGAIEVSSALFSYDGQINGGQINGPVTCVSNNGTDHITDGIFNGTVTGGSIIAGVFNGDLAPAKIAAGAELQINARLSLDNGETWFVAEGGGSSGGRGLYEELS